MTIKRVMGSVATFAGWLLLVLAAVEIGLVFYYRPTIEYTYVEGRPRSIPSWLTGELVGFASALAKIDPHLLARIDPA